MPEDFNRTLKARAARRGMSVSEFLLADVSELTQLPTLKEHAERVRSRTKADLGTSAADLIRQARDERVRELDARR